MARNPFDIAFDRLPQVLPLFPLSGALLLPNGRLPLNVFEPRYLAMTAEALAGQRLMGLIQPVNPTAAEANPPLYSVGCVGRVSFFRETEEGRLAIALTGVIRFTVGRELPLAPGGFRRVEPIYDLWRADLEESQSEPDIHRERLLTLLKPYFLLKGLNVNWKAVETASPSVLLSSVAMICPFEPGEKQALLEAPNLTERARSFIALLEMAVVESRSQKGARQ